MNERNLIQVFFYMFFVSILYTFGVVVFHFFFPFSSKACTNCVARGIILKYIMK